MLNFLLSAGLSLGSSFLVSLFGGQQKKPVTQVERNKLDRYDTPQSRYGEPIPDIYGKVRVRGVYFAAQIPYTWERDDSFNPATQTWTLTYIYYGNAGILWSSRLDVQSSPMVKKIWFNKALYYQNGTIDSTLGLYWGRFQGLSVSHGFGDQTQNDSLLNFEGAFSIPHHGIAYSAFYRLRLNNSDGGLFGTRYPDFDAEIDTWTTGTLYLNAVVKSIMLNAGYQDSEIDVTELSQIAITGYQAVVGSLSEKLSHLQLAYNFEIVDTGFKLKFITQYRSASSGFIPLSDLAAHEDGKGRNELFTQTEVIKLKDLPTTVKVIFSDINKDYQQNSKDSLSIPLFRENIETLDLSQVTLSETDAITIANRTLQLAWLRRKTYKFSVLPKYCGLEAGDVVEVPFRNGVSVSVQIKEFNQSASGLIEITAYPYDASIYGLAYSASSVNVTNATAYLNSAVFSSPLDAKDLSPIVLSNDHRGTYVTPWATQIPTDTLYSPSPLSGYLLTTDHRGTYVTPWVCQTRKDIYFGAIWVGQTNIISVDYVASYVLGVDHRGTYITPAVTQMRRAIYKEGIDYTVDLALGTVTPIVGGAITHKTRLTIVWHGREQPKQPNPPIDIGVNPYLGLPRVLSFTPSIGKHGIPIAIYGTDFTTASIAKINNVPIENFLVVDDTKITGIVPMTSTGKVTVTNPKGTGTSLMDFQV
jgi:hypothetical protein